MKNNPVIELAKVLTIARSCGGVQYDSGRILFEPEALDRFVVAILSETLSKPSHWWCPKYPDLPISLFEPESGGHYIPAYSMNPAI